MQEKFKFTYQNTNTIFFKKRKIKCNKISSSQKFLQIFKLKVKIINVQKFSFFTHFNELLEKRVIRKSPIVSFPLQDWLSKYSAQDMTKDKFVRIFDWLNEVQPLFIALAYISSDSVFRHFEF